MPNTDKRWFKSKPSTLQTQQFDREKGTIKDVVLAQVGPAKGHGVWLEQELFIEASVAYAKENHEKAGLKSRFGHPAMSDNTMGTQLGYYKNFRVRDDQMIADYQVLQAAKTSKNGDMWNWLFDMVEEKPDHVMNSVVFQAAGEYQKDESGEIHWVYVTKVGENKGYSVDSEWTENPNEKVYVAMGELYFADMVEQGAATDSLFSAGLNMDKFAVQVNEYLNENTDLDDFIKANPEKVFKLLKDRGIEFDNKGLVEQIRSLFSAKVDKSEFERLSLDNQKLSEDLANKVDELSLSNTKAVELQATIDAKEIELTAANERITALLSELDAVGFKKEEADLDLNNNKKKELAIEKRAKKYSSRK